MLELQLAHSTSMRFCSACARSSSENSLRAWCEDVTNSRAQAIRERQKGEIDGSRDQPHAATRSSTRRRRCGRVDLRHFRQGTLRAPDDTKRRHGQVRARTGTPGRFDRRRRTAHRLP